MFPTLEAPAEVLFERAATLRGLRSLCLSFFSPLSMNATDVEGGGSLEEGLGGDVCA